MSQAVLQSRAFRRDAYIVLVCLAAALLFQYAYALTETQPWTWLAVGVLVVLTVLAERRSVPLPIQSDVSIATIPHLIAVLLLPAWVAILVGASAMLIDQLLSRGGWRKLVFNTATTASTIGMAALVANF